MDDLKLDRLLDQDRVAEPRAALRARVLEAAPRSRLRRLGWLAATGLALGLATSAVAGVAVGFNLAPPSVARLVSREVAPDAGDEAAAQTADPFDDSAGA